MADAFTDQQRTGHKVLSDAHAVQRARLRDVSPERPHVLLKHFPVTSETSQTHRGSKLGHGVCDADIAAGSSAPGRHCLQRGDLSIAQGRCAGAPRPKKGFWAQNGHVGDWSKQRKTSNAQSSNIKVGDHVHVIIIHTSRLSKRFR